MTRDHEYLDRLEAATSRRLARLSARPMDVSALQRRLGAALDNETEPARVASPFRLTWWRPMIGVAAAMLLLAVILVVNTATPNAAIAAPADLARIHREVLAGQGHPQTIAVDNLQDANRLIADQSAAAATLPIAAPAPVRSCCLHKLGATMLTCALMDYRGVPVSIMVAHGHAMHSPMGQSVERDGQTFMVHQAEGLTMVMANHGERWLCVMGELPAEDLLQLAVQLRF